MAPCLPKMSMAACTDLSHVVSAIDNPEMREIFGDEWVNEHVGSIGRFEKDLEQMQPQMAYLSNEELEAFASTVNP